VLGMSGQAHNMSVYEQEYPACPGSRSVDMRDAGTANTNESYIGAAAVAGALSGILPLEEDKAFLAWVLYSGERTLTIREVRVNTWACSLHLARHPPAHRSD
jgi:hypothetical protein